MRHIDFGVPDRFRRGGRPVERPLPDTRRGEPDFDRALGSVKVTLALAKLSRYS